MSLPSPTALNRAKKYYLFNKRAKIAASLSAGLSVKSIASKEGVLARSIQGV
jgi:hypothetical protein